MFETSPDPFAEKDPVTFPPANVKVLELAHVLAVVAFPINAPTKVVALTDPKVGLKLTPTVTGPPVGLYAAAPVKFDPNVNIESPVDPDNAAEKIVNKSIPPDKILPVVFIPVPSVPGAKKAPFSPYILPLVRKSFVKFIAIIIFTYIFKRNSCGFL
jgi:hypothetical protein